MKRPQFKRRWQWIVIIVVPCVLLGLMLLVAGIGKIPWFSDLGTFPGQTEFFDVIFGSLWPTVAFFITNILPWVEIVLGVSPGPGHIPQTRRHPEPAAYCRLYDQQYLGNKPRQRHSVSCGCFGIFEKLFGNTTPLQALGMDIALLLFALIIILYLPRPLFELSIMV